MLGAFFYWQLRFGWGLPAPLALLLTLGIIAPLMGGLLYVVIIRGLRNTAEVTKIVVTVSILLGAVALSQWVWNPIEPRTLQKFFGYASNVKFLGITLTTHDLVTLGAALANALGLRMLFYRTRVGV
jgi:branched-subunit amino acid ABC-type transport system permease component